eukprot:c19904_g1_i10.p1 GENE.c19904_g1_i10~~c19904_g1_i10.p1  ORF type:complete len:322 (+),score=48.33 c19904_g1_i10:410-1375(+)
MNNPQIESYYGPDADFCPGCPSSTTKSRVPLFPDAHRMMFATSDWTDDTDQMILLTQSLLANSGRADAIHAATLLHDWHLNGFGGLGDTGGAGMGQTTKKVVTHRTFLTDPLQSALEVAKSRGNKAAANGAVMRTAVTGIPYFWDIPTVVENTKLLCLFTHADERCVASCLIVAITVAKLLQGEMDVEACVQYALSTTAAATSLPPEHLSELEAACSPDLILEELQLDDPHTLGYTFKCLSVGMWALRQPHNFSHVINRVVGQGGDADTNACVCGALLGARNGASSIPANWIAKLPYGPWLEAWIQKTLFMLRLPVSGNQK